MIELFTGLPGQGKTYGLTYRTYQGIKKGRNVFTNFPAKGAFKLTYDHLLEAEFPDNSLVIIDEMGYYFNSRDWKGFPQELYQLFSQHRKMKMDLIGAVQTARRTDVSIRELANVIWWSKNYPFFFKYEKYYDHEEIGNPDFQGKGSILLKCKKIFRMFDTYYQNIQHDRKQITFEEWFPGTAIYNRSPRFIVTNNLKKVTKTIDNVTRRCYNVTNSKQKEVIQNDKGEEGSSKKSNVI